MKWARVDQQLAVEIVNVIAMELDVPKRYQHRWLRPLSACPGSESTVHCHGLRAVLAQMD